MTKLERFHQAASHAISDFPSFSIVQIFFSEASLLPTRVTRTHFALLSYKRTLRLLTSFSISVLVRYGVKPRLWRFFCKVFVSTHTIMLPSTSPRELLFACPPFPPRNLPSFTLESTLSSPCSRSDPPLSRQGVALAHFDSLPLTICALDRWLRSFSFWQGRLRRTCQLFSRWH